MKQAISAGYGHAELLESLRQGARRQFDRAGLHWDPAPVRTSRAPDPGRGLLDCYALALHVLWTYQQAWTDEGFLATARLDSSVHRLLELVGHRPRPGCAASGLQFFRCKAGTSAILSPGFQVSAPAAGDLPEAVYETEHAIRLSAALNEMQPYLPPTPDAGVSTRGAIALVSEPTAASGSGPLIDRLRQQLTAAAGGDLSQRKAARARQRALRMAEFIRELRTGGATDICPEVLAQQCSELCRLQEEAVSVPEPSSPGRLTESAELLLSQLIRMNRQQPEAVQALEKALARPEGESEEQWAARLAGIGRFLEALIASLLQEARDQVVLLHGPQALAELDQQADPGDGGPVTTDCGVAAPGTDFLYILPRGENRNPAAGKYSNLLRPGDWLVLGEDPVSPDPEGRSDTNRRYREAVQVVRVEEQIPGQGREPMTRVVFRPPLRRRYQLSRTVLLGNIARISHGETVHEQGKELARDKPVLTPARGPLTWIQDAGAPEGYRPEMSLHVAGRSWQRVEDLRQAEATGPVFAVEQTAEGRSRIRVGDGRQGANLPGEATVSLRYRVGTGTAGNRDPGMISVLKGSHPAVTATFNPLAVTGGSEPEAADLARSRAGAGMHALGRAVSVADVCSLAESYSDIRCARAFHSPGRGREHITVLVCSEEAGPLADEEHNRVRLFLEARMPPGSAVTVGNFRTAWLRARIRLFIGAGEDPVAAIRETRLRLGLDSAAGTQAGLLDPRRVQPGRDVALSDIYRVLDTVTGLAHVHVEQLYRVDGPAGCHDRIRVQTDELALWQQEAGTDEPVAILWEEVRRP